MPDKETAQHKGNSSSTTPDPPRETEEPSPSDAYEGEGEPVLSDSVHAAVKSLRHVDDQHMIGRVDEEF